MYNTGILVETLALKKCSSRRKSLAELCSFSQFSFMQNNNYSERVCCQCTSKIRTLYDCFSFVKSFLEKEEPNDLDKTMKINESWRTITIASTPVHRFCNDSDLVHLKVQELLYSMETKVKVKVVIMYPNSENITH